MLPRQRSNSTSIVWSILCEGIFLVKSHIRATLIIMRYPNTIDKNIYLSYISKENVWKDAEQILDAINLNWDLNYPESLVELCIKTIAENWSSK